MVLVSQELLTELKGKLRGKHFPQYWMHSIKKTLSKVSLSDPLFIQHGGEEPCV